MSFLRRYGSGVLDKDLTIKTVLMAMLATVAVLCALGYILIGSTRLYDTTTMGITLALCGLLLAVLLWGGEILFPMFALLAAFFLVFVFTRILTFLYFPEWVHLPLSVALSVEQINYGYAYIAIGTAALGTGFFMGYTAFKSFLNKGCSVTLPVKVYPLRHLAIVFAIVCVIQLYVSIWLGDSVMGDMYYGVEHKFVGVISVLFSSVQALLVIFISMVASRKQGGVSTWTHTLFMLIFLVAITALGSRAGGVWIFQITLVAMLICHGNFHERLQTYVLFLSAIAVFSFVAFPVATAVRTSMIAERDSLSARAKPAPASAPAAASAPVSEHDMLSRLGAGFDTAILTMALDADQDMLSRNMNLPYALKSAVNVMVPGVVYVEAPINTAMLWPFIYKLRDIKLLKSRYYESFLWTPWGLAYSMFGWGAGLIALLTAGFILQAVYMGIAGNVSGWQPYLSAWFLFNVFSFYSAMGLDDWLVGLQRSLFSLILVLLMLWGLGKLARLRIFTRWGK